MSPRLSQPSSRFPSLLLLLLFLCGFVAVSRRRHSDTHTHLASCRPASSVIVTHCDFLCASVCVRVPALARVRRSSSSGRFVQQNKKAKASLLSKARSPFPVYPLLPHSPALLPLSLCPYRTFCHCVCVPFPFSFLFVTNPLHQQPLTDKQTQHLSSGKASLQQQRRERKRQDSRRG